VDFPQLASAMPYLSGLADGLPKVGLSITGDGQNVRTRGELRFNRPIPLELDAWNIPTNLLHEPLVSFTAIRGTKLWLPSVKWWNELSVTAPNQIYFWGLHGIPLQTYFAVPMPDASNQLDTLTDRLIEKYRPWAAANGWGDIQKESDPQGAVWKDIPFVAPYLRLEQLAESQFISGGLIPGAETNQPPPRELLWQIVGSTNLVGYNWEITGPRVEAWLYLGQLVRLLSNKEQLAADSITVAWLKTLITRLGNSVTQVRQTGSNSLSFSRVSGIGLTSIELHLLADWLESPKFPTGLRTLAAPSVPEQTNAPPQN
jgi:hypothetical protein